MTVFKKLVHLSIVTLVLWILPGGNTILRMAVKGLC